MSKLWIPSDSDVMRGEKRYRCKLCGDEFPETKFHSYKRHVTQCVRKNVDVVERMSALRKESLFTRSADPEAMEWVRKRKAMGLPAAKHGRPA